MITLTEKMARTLIDNAVTIKGEDHIQEACIYLQRTEHATPFMAENSVGESLEAGCIVGVALVQLVGIDRAMALLPEGRNAKSITILAFKLPELLGITLSQGALDVFIDAQDAQDSGRAWGEVRDSLG